MGGMDLLWQEKTRLDEELMISDEGYNRLSQQLAEEEEEGWNVDEQIRKYDSLLTMLQENAEKQRNNVSSPGQASPAAAAASPDEDDNESNYDDFEPLGDEEN